MRWRGGGGGMERGRQMRGRNEANVNSQQITRTADEEAGRPTGGVAGGGRPAEKAVFRLSGGMVYTQFAF